MFDDFFREVHEGAAPPHFVGDRGLQSVGEVMKRKRDASNLCELGFLSQRLFNDWPFLIRQALAFFTNACVADFANVRTIHIRQISAAYRFLSLETAHPMAYRDVVRRNVNLITGVFTLLFEVGF